MQLSFKNISTAYVLLLLTLKMMSLPVILLQYNLNKAYIAANLCENRNKPQLHCNGTCHLKKQLAKTVETPDSQDNSNKGTIKIVTVDFVETTSAPSFDMQLSLTSIFQPRSNYQYAAGYSPAVFHPPAA